MPAHEKKRTSALTVAAVETNPRCKRVFQIACLPAHMSGSEAAFPVHKHRVFY